MTNFVSQLKTLIQKHNKEIEDLRKACPHDKKFIKIDVDYGVVGAGSCFPSVHVICRNCGGSKVIFHLTPKQRRKVRKTLKRQFPTFNGSRYYKDGSDKPDERLDLATDNLYELE